MADDRCRACRHAEIQPAMFGLRTEERCAHPSTEQAPEQPGERVTYPSLAEARRPHWPCGPAAALFGGRRHD